MKLSQKIKIFLILIVEIIQQCRTDCGCNKIKREEVKISTKQIDQQCSTKNENSNYCSAPKINLYENMSLISGGNITMGTKTAIFHEDHESPEKFQQIMDFYIDKFEVSNEQFQQFVHNTGYKTQAEKFGDSFVFKGLINDSIQNNYKDKRVLGALWWYKIDNVDWRHPESSDSNIDDRLNHPVVHVSWHDAIEYCRWKQKRLPSEAEWETACRGGRHGKLFPWGDKLNPKNKHWMNIWQGEFPDQNLNEDGYYATCPIDKFRQNQYDLYNIVGNVWEWTLDFWDRNEASLDNIDTVKRVKKGGSYLCHASYCYRYRCAARSQNTADSSAGNLGFRCAMDVVNK